MGKHGVAAHLRDDALPVACSPNIKPQLKLASFQIVKSRQGRLSPQKNQKVFPIFYRGRYCRVHHHRRTYHARRKGLRQYPCRRPYTRGRRTRTPTRYSLRAEGANLLPALLPMKPILVDISPPPSTAPSNHIKTSPKVPSTPTRGRCPRSCFSQYFRPHSRIISPRLRRHQGTRTRTSIPTSLMPAVLQSSPRHC